MRIIQITPYYPPRIGGVPNVTRELSERLAKKGHQVEVFTSDIDCNKGKLRLIKNLKIHYLRSWQFAHTPIIPSLLFKLLKISKDSIMHVHIAQAFVPEIVYLVSKIKRISYIAHVHGDIISSGKYGFLLPLYKKLFIKIILSKAKKVICLSKDYKQFINKNYGINESKIIVIPNGVSEKYFMNKAKKINKIPNLLFVGRLSVEKNIPKLIEATSLLKNKVILHIIGEGEKKEDLKKLILEKGIKNIILHGEKTGKELINFYKHADIFLLASSCEGLPLTLLEAMASQTPIIASNVRGIREIAGNVGILVSPPTSENFAIEIDKLIENKKIREKLAEKGRRKAKEYDWDRVIVKIEEIYR